MSLRSYARAKAQYTDGLKEPDLKKRPQGGWIEEVRSVVFELAQEKIDAFKAQT